MRYFPSGENANENKCQGLDRTPPIKYPIRYRKYPDKAIEDSKVFSIGENANAVS